MNHPVDSIVGCWRLKSIDRRSGTAADDNPFGPNPVGYLIYTDTGHMTEDFMRAERPDTRTSVGAKLDDASLAAAARGYHSYCGRYEARGNQIYHYVEASLIPDEVGTGKVREMLLTADSLTLVVHRNDDPDSWSNDTAIARVSWLRCHPTGDGTS
jgi:hypothetical protein